MARLLLSALSYTQPSLIVPLVNSSVIGEPWSWRMSQLYHRVFTSGWISRNASIVLACQFCGCDLKGCRINCYFTWGKWGGESGSISCFTPFASYLHEAFITKGSWNPGYNDNVGSKGFGPGWKVELV